MNRAIFLDRDGTINVDYHYINDPAQIKLIPGVVKGLKKLQEAGFLLIVVSNQSGVGRGYFSEEKLKRINHRLKKLLKEKGVILTAIYYAPYYPHAKDPKYREGEYFRKPNPGMLIQASKDYNIYIPSSYIIGDKESDIGAGINAGVKATILLSKKKPQLEKYIPDIIVKNIPSAAEWILKKEQKILIGEENLKKIVGELKQKKKKIVTTNGVFDILHIGHKRYLEKAKQKGDILIVAINSDSSARKLGKGEGRPVVNQFLRAEMVSALECVDYVYIFYEEDPRRFLEIVKPDIHVKGGDYSSPEELIEYNTVTKNNGRVEIIPLVKGFSTTNLIETIKKKIK